jgi:hypothetical protein
MFKKAVMVTCARNSGIVFVVNCRRVAACVVVRSGMVVTSLLLLDSLFQKRLTGLVTFCV